MKTIGYRTLHNASVNQNGHTFTVKLNLGSNDGTPMILDGSLPSGEKFAFAQLHLHWGSDSFRGSEHRLAGQEFPAEIHLVHWNTKYPDFPTAAQQSDGLAVAGFFLQVSDKTNDNYVPVINGLIKLAGQPDYFDVDIGTLSLRSLLPTPGAADHLHYKGSLTTPPCTENVFWNVFLDPINISEEQLNTIRGLRRENNQLLSDNYRPPMPSNGRPIYLYRRDLGLQFAELLRNFCETKSKVFLALLELFTQRNRNYRNLIEPSTPEKSSYSDFAQLCFEKN